MPIVVVDWRGFKTGGERRNSAPGAYRAAQIRVARICAYPMLIAYYAYTNAEEGRWYF